MNRDLTVSELNRRVATLLAEDPGLSDLHVLGELTNFKAYPSGHLYFSLKDDKAVVACVMFRGQAQRLAFRPQDGDRVRVGGQASLYEKDGRYQLYVSSMQRQGLGDLHQAFEAMKERLQKEGLFDPAAKKPLPFLPRTIGVVTSPAGAVIRDILTVLGRRFPGFRLILHPVPVQGPDAAPAIAEAIRTFNRLRLADVLVVARGGGSLEDLWAFNEEVVARAVFASEIPVVSAVGHETDFTICDFVADIRAATPSAAAELVMPRREDLVLRVLQAMSRGRNAVDQRLRLSALQLDRLLRSPVLRNPLVLLDRRRETLDRLLTRLQHAASTKLGRERTRMAGLVSGLQALSPLHVLSKGYGMVTDKKTGRPVISTAMIQAGDLLDIWMQDGILECQVRSIRDRGRMES